MDHQIYFNAIDRMEKLAVDREYIHGWIGGFMKNPKREEQRLTEAYEAGYADGENADQSKFENWIVPAPAEEAE